MQVRIKYTEPQKKLYTSVIKILANLVVCCLFRFNITFNNFSVISRWCLAETESSMLIFIVLPHWSIMSQTHDMIPHPATLSWHWVDQLVPFLTTLACHRPGSNPWPPVPWSRHSTDWTTGTSEYFTKMRKRYNRRDIRLSNAENFIDPNLVVVLVFYGPSTHFR